MASGFAEYRVCLSRDEETELIVADIPTLGIADDGPDAPTALDSVREMALFHIEGLIEEGKAVPTEASQEEGIFIRIRLPARAHPAASL